MIEGAEFIAMAYGLEHGIQMRPNGEASVVITRAGDTEVLDVESFPNRADALQFITNLANHVPMTPVLRRVRGNSAAMSPKGRKTK